MALDTRLNLSNQKFEQSTGDTLNLSGNTFVFGSLRYPIDKSSSYTKHSFIDFSYFTGNTGFIFSKDFALNLNSVKSNIDIIGKGTITLTSGSTNIVGTNTDFLTNTPGLGFNYWLSFHITDALNRIYRVDVASVQDNTNAQIAKVYSENDIKNGYSSSSSVFTGTTGTYPYKLVTNYAKDLYAFSLGNKSYASNFGISLGGSTVATGSNAVAFGSFTTASGSQGFSLGRNTLASGSRSFAGGVGSITDGDRRVKANGNGSFNFSENTLSQTITHGALAPNSVILGGQDHNIPSNSNRSVIIGGNTIKAASAVTDTIYIPKLRLGLGIGGSLSLNNSNNNLLVRNSSTGEVELRDASTLTGTTLTFANGLNKSHAVVRLGGSLTGTTFLYKSSTAPSTTDLYVGSSAGGTVITELPRSIYFLSNQRFNTYIPSGATEETWAQFETLTDNSVGNFFEGWVTQDGIEYYSRGTFHVFRDQPATPKPKIILEAAYNIPNSGTTFTIHGPNSNDPVGAVFDDPLYQKGITYSSDYTNTFDDLSLVHKLYVDNKVTVTSAANGLNLTNKQVRFGGTITGSTYIPINDNFTLRLGATSSEARTRYSFIDIIENSTSDNKVQAFVYNDTGSNNYTSILLEAQSGNGNRLVLDCATSISNYTRLQLTNSSGFDFIIGGVSRAFLDQNSKWKFGSGNRFVIDTITGAVNYGGTSGTTFIFSGTTGFKGVEYLADYSSNFIKRSIPDVAWVTGKTSTLLLNTRNSTSYTLILDDAGKLIEGTVTGATTITVPPNSGVTFSIGTQILIVQYGTGQITIVPGTGVTLRSFNNNTKLSGQYSMATLIKRGTNEWYLSGDLTS